MDADELKELINKNPVKIAVILERFNKTNANLFEFKQFHQNNLWLQLWKAIFGILIEEDLEEFHILALNTARILSRDKSSLQQHNIDSSVDSLLRLAYLTPENNLFEKNTNEGESEFLLGCDDVKTSKMVEALKCLCNLVFQNSECRRRCVRQNIVDYIIQRMSITIQISNALELYDMKLLFLITALEPSTRSRVMIELNGLAYMTESLHERLNNEQFTDQQLDVIVELLKAMHNVVSYSEKSLNENEIQNLHLTGVVRELLSCFGSLANEKERAVISNCINLLVYISSSCLVELMVKYDNNGEENTFERICIFQKYNVYALNVLLRFFHVVMEEWESGAVQNDLISPILTVLVKCVSSNRIMRHYIRSVVLPPLKEAASPPEVGKELRNYLCRLQSSPDEIVRDLAYELLFLCCKKNARRMVKYFGYGNMAGLFCKKGMLDCRRIDTEFSSDNDDSDTEEYKKIQPNINPVTGSYVTPTSINASQQNMTEEEKEYHAMQLVNVIDKLQRGGLIKPCNIGQDGKLQPVNHILELQKDFDFSNNIHPPQKN